MDRDRDVGASPNSSSKLQEIRRRIGTLLKSNETLNGEMSRLGRSVSKENVTDVQFDRDAHAYASLEDLAALSLSGDDLGAVGAAEPSELYPSPDTSHAHQNGLSANVSMAMPTSGSDEWPPTPQQPSTPQGRRRRSTSLSNSSSMSPERVYRTHMSAAMQEITSVAAASAGTSRSHESLPAEAMCTSASPLRGPALTPLAKALAKEREAVADMERTSAALRDQLRRLQLPSSEEVVDQIAPNRTRTSRRGSFVDPLAAIAIGGTSSSSSDLIKGIAAPESNAFSRGRSASLSALSLGQTVAVPSYSDLTGRPRSSSLIAVDKMPAASIGIGIGSNFDEQQQQQQEQQELRPRIRPLSSGSSTNALGSTKQRPRFAQLMATSRSTAPRKHQPIMPTREGQHAFIPYSSGGGSASSTSHLPGQVVMSEGAAKRPYGNLAATSSIDSIQQQLHESQSEARTLRAQLLVAQTGLNRSSALADDAEARAAAAEAHSRGLSERITELQRQLAETQQQQASVGSPSSSTQSRTSATLALEHRLRLAEARASDLDREASSLKATKSSLLSTLADAECNLRALTEVTSAGQEREAALSRELAAAHSEVSKLRRELAARTAAFEAEVSGRVAAAERSAEDMRQRRDAALSAATQADARAMAANRDAQKMEARASAAEKEAAKLRQLLAAALAQLEAAGEAKKAGVLQSVASPSKSASATDSGTASSAAPPPSSAQFLVSKGSKRAPPPTNVSGGSGMLSSPQSAFGSGGSALGAGDGSGLDGIPSGPSSGSGGLSSGGGGGGSGPSSSVLSIANRFATTGSGAVPRPAAAPVGSFIPRATTATAPASGGGIGGPYSTPGKASGGQPGSGSGVPGSSPSTGSGSGGGVMSSFMGFFRG